MKTTQPQVTKRTGISDGKIQKGKVYIYIYFLERKQGCCLYFGSCCLVNKKIIEQVASFIKECQYVGLARLKL